MINTKETTKMTVPKRLAIKFNLKQNPTFASNTIVPVFQRWIQEHAVEGLLIDVTNYSHVQDGPGVILIADEGDYGYDLSNGQVGLRYTRKRFLPDTLEDALRLVLRLAVIASQRLEDEDVLEGTEFNFTSAEISFLDRQTYQNNPATFEAVQRELIKFLSGLYGTEVNLSRTYDDSREVFSVSYSVPNADVNILLSNLTAVQQPAS
jgi:hypothetical protein